MLRMNMDKYTQIKTAEREGVGFQGHYYKTLRGPRILSISLNPIAGWEVNQAPSFGDLQASSGCAWLERENFLQVEVSRVESEREKAPQDTTP
jgi:hypothetical protein